MTTLNDTFEKKFAQEDDGYDNGSESLNFPHSSQKSTTNIPHLNE